MLELPVQSTQHHSHHRTWLLPQSFL